MKPTPRIFISILLYFLLLCPNAQAKTVVTEGEVYMGHGITLEEAELIALNDARQKALNSLGVFVESESTVVNYRLARDEIRTIAGAVMTSEVLESTKVVSQGVFVLKIKAKFDISESSLQQALRNYQDKSTEQRTIKHLVETIKRLQIELANHRKSTPETVELVDEIDFSSKRLGKLLTTREAIDYELQMQEFYIKKAKIHFTNNVFLKLYNDIVNFLKWESIPTLGPRESLRLNFIRFRLEYLEKHICEYVSSLDSIAWEYDKLHLKVRPKFNFNIEFAIPVYVYINAKKTMKFFWIKLYREKLSSELIISPGSAKDYSIILGIKVTQWAATGHENDIWDIEIPAGYTLANIENIDIRIGRVSPRDIKFSFFEGS